MAVPRTSEVLDKTLQVSGITMAASILVCCRHPMMYTDCVMLAKKLKDAATAAFRENSRLGEMSPEEREQAAQGYEQMAQQMAGTQAGLARLYNLERAKFLRGHVSRIAARALDFAVEIGYPDKTDTGQTGD
jgi:hypothetical protein